MTLYSAENTGDFSNTVSTYYNYAYKICQNIMLKDDRQINPQDIEDVLQDSFLKLYLCLQKIEKVRSVKALLAVIVRNTTIDAQKAREVIERHTSDIEEESASFHDELLDTICINEAAEALVAQIRRLDEKYAQIFLLMYECDLSIRQIATVLDVPEKTIYTRYDRGRKMLQKIINGGMNNGD